MKSLIFGAEDMRAHLDGRKRMTRRVLPVFPYSENWVSWNRLKERQRKPPLRVGDLFYAKETWQAVHFVNDCETNCAVDLWQSEGVPKDDADGYWYPVYKCPDPRNPHDSAWDEHPDDRGFSWRSPLCMPEWASRFRARVTSVRVERVQDISREDCVAEGYPDHHGETHYYGCDGVHSGYAAAWDRINWKRHPWSSNPWVWVYGYEEVKP